MTDILDREHWAVHGLSRTGPDATVRVRARLDGSVVLHLTCGDRQAEVRLDACRATQLCTGIWEATTASQGLAVDLGNHQLRWRKPSSTSRPATPITRAIGMRIQRIRIARRKSLRVVAELAGTSTATLHRIEHGRREVTLAEIVALADALQTTPAALTPAHLNDR